MLTQLGSEDARKLLSESRLGRLGCIDAGRPYVVPVNYVFENGNIYIHSLPGRKIAALRINPKTCLQVDEIIDEIHWRSAIAFGDFVEITDPAERERAVQLLYGRFPRLTPVESVPVHDGQSAVTVFKIKVEEMTAVGER